MSNHYDISEVYGNVVQGEGLHAGYPCHVLRMSGCNLWPDADKPSFTCPWCDTPNLHDHHKTDIRDLLHTLEYMHDIAPHHGLIVTGGEPLLQLDADLMGCLSDMFPWIDIETNGTVSLQCSKPQNAFISCSPKTTLIKVEGVDWYKLLIPDKEHLLQNVLARANSERAAVYVQPVEIGGYHAKVTQENIRRCLDICNKFGTVRLSIQLHKVVGVK